MAIGTCSLSARKLFAVTLGLYLFGFLFMVGFWNNSADLLEDIDTERILKHASIRESSSEVDYSQYLPSSNSNNSLEKVVKDDQEKDDQEDLVAVNDKDDSGVHHDQEVDNAPFVEHVGAKEDVENQGAKESEQINDTGPSMMTKFNWDALQTLRKSQLKHACQKLADKPPLNADMANVLAKHKRQFWPFIVNDQYKLMYCYISKVGSTHWKMAFLVLLGKYKRVEDVPGKRAHDPSLKKLSSYKTEEEISTRLNNYTIFVFVRNPFARVISGYRSKLLQPNPSYHKSVGRTIIKRYRQNPTEAELKGDNVTFPEFVRYLTDPRTKNLDGHFKPMYQMVMPCSVRFDYIGKLETAEEDAKYILQDTHVDHLIHFKQTQRNVSHDQATFDQYFAKVPREDVKKLYQLYYPDFELFGYELPEYMRSWVQ